MRSYHSLNDRSVNQAENYAGFTFQLRLASVLHLFSADVK